MAGANKVKFGSEEWLEKVEKIYDFPAVLAAYVASDGSGIWHKEVETKAYNVGNIKYEKVAPYTLLGTGTKLALVEVRRIHSAQHYYEWAKELNEVWGQKKY